VTAVRNPVDGADSLKELLTTVRSQHGLVLAGGQGDLVGRICRSGHLGMIDDSDVYSILATLEQGLHETGMRSRVGMAVPAAQAASSRAVTSRRPAAMAMPCRAMLASRARMGSTSVMITCEPIPRARDATRSRSRMPSASRSLHFADSRSGE